jgi:hypothetical protein
MLRAHASATPMNPFKQAKMYWLSRVRHGSVLQSDLMDGHKSAAGRVDNLPFLLLLVRGPDGALPPLSAICSLCCGT